MEDWQEGVADRAQGAVGRVGAALTGDRQMEEKWMDVHDAGKDKQRKMEEEVQRRNQ